MYKILTIVSCQPRNSASSLQKNVGDSTLLRCLDSVKCPGTTYYFYKRNVGITKLVHQGSQNFRFLIRTLGDGGEFCCAKQCTEEVGPVNECKCYWNVTSKTDEEALRQFAYTYISCTYCYPSHACTRAHRHSCMHTKVAQYYAKQALTIRSSTELCAFS